MKVQKDKYCLPYSCIRLLVKYIDHIYFYVSNYFLNAALVSKAQVFFTTVILNTVFYKYCVSNSACYHTK